MKVRVIGCHGGIAPEYQTTCYYVEDTLLIDCGSACSSLTPREQFEIEDIFITHPHLDHIKDIAFLLENTFDPDRAPIVLRSTPEILQDIHNHLLNDVIWPDFSKIPVGANRDKFLLKFAPFEKEVVVNDIKVSHFKVNHPGNAVGFLVDDGKEQVLFTGDSGPCATIWKAANECKNLKAVFSEISFPSRMDALATASGHFTIEQLVEDIKQLKHDVPVYISHFKPIFLQELLDEFDQKAPDNFQLMHQDDEFNL